MRNVSRISPGVYSSTATNYARILVVKYRPTGVLFGLIYFFKFNLLFTNYWQEEHSLSAGNTNNSIRRRRSVRYTSTVGPVNNR